MPEVQGNNKNFSANAQTVDLDVRDVDFATGVVTGAFVGTVTFQVSNDKTNYFTKNGTPTNSATPASTLTAAGALEFDVRYWAYLRATTTAYTSGTPATVLAAKQRPS